MSAAAMKSHPAKVRAAPYAVEIEEAIRLGRRPNVRLFAGREAWERAQRHRDRFGPASALVLPPGENPLELRWPRLSDLVADIRGVDGQTVRDLGTALIRAGARLVFAIDADNPDRSVRFVRKRDTK
jgi:hypothetical protein